MGKFLFVVLLLYCGLSLHSQVQPAVIDSMKSKLALADTDEEKLEMMGNLSRTLMSVDLKEADKYGFEMISLAEKSRDRKLMVKAFLTNGERYSYLTGRRENIEKAIEYYNKGLKIARDNEMDEQVVRSYLLLSAVHRHIPDPVKALEYSNEAFSQASQTRSDSLIAEALLESGSVNLLRSEKLLALRNYLSALRIAEELKNPQLLRLGYSRLSVFYAELEDFEKAIDYQVRAMNTLDEIKSGQTPYNRVVDLNRVGELYGRKKDFSMAMLYYDQSLRKADSLHYEPLKIMGYRNIVNNYLSAQQPGKAMAYFNDHPQLKQYLEMVNLGYFVDQSYGYIYAQLGKYDSALYYYNRAAPFFENTVSTSNQYFYYFQLGSLYRKILDFEKALKNFRIAEKIAIQTGNLDHKSEIARQLDSIYQAKGDFREAYHYASLYTKFQDSLQKLGREKDLMQAEAADEQQRQDRIAREIADQKRRKNNIQYLAITIGIVAFFVILVLLGMFKVSTTMIRMIGFFAFIMFFEFIFLISKKFLYSITQGEPWKDLAFMIVLAALLLPLHHWMEEKVIHYLTSHNRLTAAGMHLKKKLSGGKAGQG